MFNLIVDHQINSVPWDISLEERCQYLNKMVDLGYSINLLIYEYPDTSTFRYRGYNIYQIMQGSDKWKVVYFFRHELNVAKLFLQNVRIVTISRVKWNHDLHLFIDLVKEKNIPVIFDVDDRIYDLDYLPLVTNTLNVDFKTNPEQAYDFWFAQIGRIEMSARQADAYIGTNAFLCDTFMQRFHKKGYIIPNFLNKEQIEISEICRKQKLNKKSDNPFTIGYFSGTPSHINDFKIIYKELMQLLYECDNMFLNVVGFMEFPSEMNELIKVGKVKFSGLVDFVKLQELIAGVDVNIVPLVVNDFTNCKSELKFFEAAMVNTVTVASHSYTYENSIKHAQTGFLCHPTQWYSTIKDIYDGKYNLDTINQNAYDYVIKNYTGNKIIKQIEDVYNSICEEIIL